VKVTSIVKIDTLDDIFKERFKIYADKKREYGKKGVQRGNDYGEGCVR